MSPHARRTWLLVLLLAAAGCGGSAPDPGTGLSVVGRDAQWRSRLEAGRRAAREGDPAAAEERFRSALEVAEQFGPRDRRLATALNELGQHLAAHDRFDEAEPLLRRAVEVWEQALGKGHPDAATGRFNLATLHHRRKKYAEAEPLYREALAVVEKHPGPDSRDLVQTLHGLAELYVAQGRDAEAEPLYRRGLEVTRKELGANHLDVADWSFRLAELYRRGGRHADAEPRYRESLAVLEKQLGERHADLAPVLEGLAATLRQAGRPAEAGKLEERARSLRPGT